MSSSVTSLTNPLGLQLTAIPGKGRGFVATQRFNAGDVLIRDDAVHAESHVAAARCLLLNDKYTWLKENLHGAPVTVFPPLPGDLKKSVSKAAWNKAFSQVEANVWMMDNGVVLFPLLSFLNHSCAPNAVIDLESSIAYACNTIEEGQEVCVSYTYVRAYAPTQFRRELLKSGWHFVCHCARCDDPTSDHLISLSNRIIIRGSQEDQLAHKCCMHMSKFGINSSTGSMVHTNTGQPGQHNVLDKLPDEAIILLSQSEQTPALFRAHQWAVHAARSELLFKFRRVDLERIYPSLTGSNTVEEHRKIFLELCGTHLVCQALVLSKCHLLKHVTFLQLYLVAIDKLGIQVSTFMKWIASLDDDYKDDSLLWKVFGRVCNGCRVTMHHSMRCGRCKSTYYCSRECQVSDWKSAHKKLCEPVATTQPPKVA